MSQPQFISRQRKTLQNAACAVTSENTIGGLSGERQEGFHHHSSSWKPQAPPPTKPHPTLLFQPHAAPQTTTIQPLSMQTKLQTQPPSPLLTPFLLPLPVYLELMSTSFFPTSPLCSANVPCSNQLKSGVWASLAKSAFFLPHSGPHHHQPSTFPLRPWKTSPSPIDIAIYDGSDSLLIAGSTQTQLLCVPIHIKCICQ